MILYAVRMVGCNNAIARVNTNHNNVQYVRDLCVCPTDLLKLRG